MNVYKYVIYTLLNMITYNEYTSFDKKLNKSSIRILYNLYDRVFRIYLKHVRLFIFRVFDNNSLCPGKCVRNRVLLRVEDGLRTVGRFNDVVLATFNTIWHGSFV